MVSIPTRGIEFSFISLIWQEGGESRDRSVLWGGSFKNNSRFLKQLIVSAIVVGSILINKGKIITFKLFSFPYAGRTRCSVEFWLLILTAFYLRTFRLFSRNYWVAEFLSPIENQIHNCRVYCHTLVPPSYDVLQNELIKLNNIIIPNKKTPYIN